MREEGSSLGVVTWLGMGGILWGCSGNGTGPQALGTGHCGGLTTFTWRSMTTAMKGGLRTHSKCTAGAWASLTTIQTATRKGWVVPRQS